MPRLSLILLLLILIASPCYAAKGYFLVKMQGGSPVLDQQKTPYLGYVLIGQKGNCGAYIVSTETTEQLKAIDRDPDAILIATKDAPLNDKTVTAHLNRVQQWLATEGVTLSLNVNMTKKEIARAVLQSFHDLCDDVACADVIGSAEDEVMK